MTDEPTATTPAPRSAQLDAQRLDHELASILRSALTATVSDLLGPPTAAQIQPELDLSAHALLFPALILRRGSSPGSDLLNLRLSGGSSRWLALGALTLGVRYVWTRLQLAARTHGWLSRPVQSTTRRLYEAMELVDRTGSVLHAAHTLLFFAGGTHRALSERVCGLMMEARDPDLQRIVSYQLLSQQLVWRELAEVASSAIRVADPVRLRALGRVILRCLVQPAMKPLLAALNGGSMPGPEGRPTRGHGGGRDEAQDTDPRLGRTPPKPVSSSSTTSQPRLRPPSAAGTPTGVATTASRRPPLTWKCTACHGRVDVPYVAQPCEHLYCYLCVRTQCLDDRDYACRRCHVRVEGMRRLPGG